MNKLAIISDRIKQSLIHHKLKKSDLAKLMNVQPSIITRWLSGNHNFTIDTLFKIESVLDIKIFDLPSIDNSITFKMSVSSSVFTGNYSA